jgi:hypothetical protein
MYQDQQNKEQILTHVFKIYIYNLPYINIPNYQEISCFYSSYYLSIFLFHLDKGVIAQRESYTVIFVLSQEKFSLLLI